MQVDEDNVPILVNAPGERSLRPKDAATLLVIRRDGRSPRVLMGRRAKGHVFMASKWVFPGGRIHPSDYRVPAASELDIEAAAPLLRTAPAAKARALAAAAVRELFEETGLVLGAPGMARTRSKEWRDFLATGRLPHLAPLRFVGRAITPPVRPRRFDARFFTVEAEHLASLDPGSGCGELDEIAWFNWEEAAALDLPSITRAILADVAARLDDPARPIPYHRFDNGRHRLLTL
ncbi:NUDIX hydrolase [Sandarakinorhabdus rubra]|uniref:NUDIX hydrolase n=1 Tax=Sandarakinorhabdus rubra TaxID=2672568 RepID=UPI0013DB3264|nr:NUDIX hydrolase [Sandarakinorhabdus rubra]